MQNIIRFRMEEQWRFPSCQSLEHFNQSERHTQLIFRLKIKETGRHVFLKS